ncbi:energy-coupling factor ABC transporter substrate-binding protein [Cumulibacter manganitolerans]|uniref:energy-coupling factor ABC transporter substrate-binding protein n=1 Tax=Cumulibacter manganitolerans TaxID=1884992 RepID=UPI0012958DE6|nr:energy-coupling factor ABC transporter substrate-binding protein [Cumulibacter manganitolerans]
MRRCVGNVLIVAAIVGLFALALVLGGRGASDGKARFAGTDSSATAQIEKSNPGYERWFAPIFSPRSGEVESGLFAMQAALGAGVLGFALGALWQRGRAARAGRSDGARTTDAPDA